MTTPPPGAGRAGRGGLAVSQVQAPPRLALSVRIPGGGQSGDRSPGVCDTVVYQLPAPHGESEI